MENNVSFNGEIVKNKGLESVEKVKKEIYFAGHPVSILKQIWWMACEISHVCDFFSWLLDPFPPFRNPKSSIWHCIKIMLLKLKLSKISKAVSHRLTKCEIILPSLSTTYRAVCQLIFFPLPHERPVHEEAASWEKGKLSQFWFRPTPPTYMHSSLSLSQMLSFWIIITKWLICWKEVIIFITCTLLLASFSLHLAHAELLNWLVVNWEKSKTVLERLAFVKIAP